MLLLVLLCRQAAADVIGSDAAMDGLDADELGVAATASTKRGQVSPCSPTLRGPAKAKSLLLGAFQVSWDPRAAQLAVSRPGSSQVPVWTHTPGSAFLSLATGPEVPAVQYQPEVPVLFQVRAVGVGQELE